MSDKVYLPSDIPYGYDYGVYSNGYITLYDRPSAQNETLTYYRIYYGYSDGLVTTGTTTFGQYNRTYFEQIPTSRDFFDRPDCFKIVTIVFILCFFGVWLFNLITSFIRKGGLLRWSYLKI